MITMLSSVSLFLLVLLALVLFAGSRVRKENSVLKRRLEAAQSGDWTSSEDARAAAVVERTRALAEQGRTTVRTLSERMERVLVSVTAVRGNGERLSAEARGLSEAVDAIAGAFVEISANTESLADLIVRQATAVEQSSAAVSQMSASARSMAESVEARKAAHVRLSEATKAGATTAAAAGEVIAAFADRAGKMTESISVIDSIASSTNLLAMNAAIEAAHAGQYGKGFAVVADEIRKLASDTSERAGEVSALLSSLNDAIAKAREAGAETTRVFAEIESIAAETVNSFAELANGIGELAQGTHEVSQSTSTLADITEQIKTGAREVADATSSINEGLQKSGGAAKNSARETAELERSLIELNLGLLALSDLNVKNGSGTDAIVGELASLRTGKSGDALVAGALDFKTVRLRHKEWVSKIRLAFADALELRSEDAASPRACMLGKWLYEGGGVGRIAGRAGAADLERVHDGIHRLVADILREKGKLSREGLDARVAELERGSEELVGILDRLERDLAAVV